MPKNAIEVSDVFLNFGSVKALNGVDLKTSVGKVTGLPRPNGTYYISHSLIWIVVIIAIFAPLAVHLYRKIK